MVGKIVTVRIHDKENSDPFNKGYYLLKGKCYYYGYNEFLGVMQITLNRNPIYPIKQEDIVNIEEDENRC